MSSSEPLSVSTDKKKYFQGDRVFLTAGFFLTPPTRQIQFHIYNPKGQIYRSGQMRPSYFGLSSFSFIVGGSLGMEGRYEAQVTLVGRTATTHFEVMKSSRGQSVHAYFLFIDIVGLTRVGSTQDQIKKIDALNNAIRSSTQFMLLKETKSLRFVYPTGDGAVIGFTDYPEAALTIAIEVQLALKNYNAGREEDEEVSVRMGIDHGPVTMIKDVLNNDNIYGPAVVGARRIMDLGREDHILVSESARNDLLGISSEYDKVIGLPLELKSKHGRIVKCCNVYGKDFGSQEPPTDT